MDTVSVNKARKQLADLINAVTHGREVAISRRGKPVAKLSPVTPSRRPRLPDLSDFRKSLGRASGKGATIQNLRKQDRY